MRGCYHADAKMELQGGQPVRTWIWTALTLALLSPLASCDTATVPPAVADYRTSEECVVMNLTAVPPDDEVPHAGYKTIYACHSEPEILFEAGSWVGPPYPEGTLIVKESCMWGPCGDLEEDFVFLLATADKQDGTWEWREYTRNFPTEELLEIGLPSSVCVGCHEDVKAADWMFTGYEPR